MTDTHIPAAGGASGEEAAENLRQAVREINLISPKPRFCVITGDIAAERGKMGEYASFKRIIAELKIPYFTVPGNHDDSRVFGFTAAKSSAGRGGVLFEHCSHLYFLLDSSVRGKLSGWIDERQFEWLRKELDERPDRPALFFLHHSMGGCSPGKEKPRYPLLNARRFIQFLERYPQVKLVAHGHSHHSCLRQRKHFLIMSTMSTANGFSPESDVPGYRIIEVMKDGTVRSFDKRLGKDVREDQQRK